MIAALTVLEIVAPVFLLAGAGWIWARRGLNYDIEFVTRIGMSLSMPCLVFSVLTSVEIQPAAFRTMAVATLALYGVIALLTVIAVRLLKLDRRTYLAPLTFANTGNLGLPLCMFAFGEVGLAYAVVLLAIMMALSFTIGIWMVAGSASPLRTLTQPIFLSPALGILWALTGWPVPEFAARTLELAGQPAIPLMLVTLGVSIAKLNVRGIGQAVSLSFLKLAIGVGVGFGISRLFNLDGVAQGVVMIQAAMPVAVTAYLLAERYRADATAVAGLVVVSTLLSVAALPVLLAFLI